MRKLIEIRNRYFFARDEYECAVRKIVCNSDVMDDKNLFWKMVNDLRDQIVNHLRRDDAVRFGCSEFVRKLFAEGGEGYSCDHLPNFIRTYNKLKSTLFVKLTKTVKYNDNFGDFIDSLPLAGQRTCLLIILNTPVDEHALEKLVTEGCEDCPVLGAKILKSENRVEHNLEEAYCNNLCYFSEDVEDDTCYSI